MTTLRIPAGGQLRVGLTFTDLTLDPLAAYDPESVTLTVTDPSGQPVTYTYGIDALLVRTAVGRYRADITAPVAGPYRLRSVGTGTVIAVTTGNFSAY